MLFLQVQFILINCASFACIGKNNKSERKWLVFDDKRWIAWLAKWSNSTFLRNCIDGFYWSWHFLLIGWKKRIAQFDWLLQNHNKSGKQIVVKCGFFWEIFMLHCLLILLNMWHICRRYVILVRQKTGRIPIFYGKGMTKS